MISRFHYDVVKKKYWVRAHLLMTDKDSLLYGVEMDDIYDDMVNSGEMSDLSNYPPTHRKYNADFALNRGKGGLRQDEVPGNIVTELFGLRAKMSSFVIAQNKADGTVKTGNMY